MEENKKIMNEIVNIYNRERIDVISVIEVMSSTEKQVVVKLENGFLEIGGEKLTITKLIPNEKSLSVNGTIISLNFTGKLSKKSFLGKVFK